MDKLLIIGIDNLAGSNLALTLRDRYEVLGVGCSEDFALQCCRILPTTLENFAVLQETILNEQPQWTVYCGPTSRSSWDWQNEVDWVRESKRVGEIARATADCGSRLTLISTDAIFHGPRLFSRESFASTDRPGSTAVRRIEQAAAGVEALIVRTHLFGWSPAGESCVEQIQSAIPANRPHAASGNQYASPILATDFAELLYVANRKRLVGIHHLAGAERISMWQFATRLAHVDDSSDENSQASLTAGAMDESNKETSLDSRATQRLLGSPLPMLRDGISRFLSQAVNGHRDRLRAAVPKRPLSAVA